MLAFSSVATFTGWENAFIATSVALGASAEEACRSLDDAAAARAEPLVRRLRDGAREARARALATGLAHIAVAIEKTRLA